MTCSRTHVSRVGARWTLRLGIVLLGWATAWGQTPPPEVGPAAESDSANAEEHTTKKELQGLTNPTILRRRVWLETEWDKYNGGVHGVEETLGALWAWRLSASQEWAVRLKVPYEWRIASDRGTSQQGLGDLKLAIPTSFRLGQSWHAAAGLELRMPTSADNLGSRDWRLQEIGAVAWDVTHWLTLSPSFEYNESVAEPDNARPQNYLEMYFPATFLLPRHWSVTPRYEAKVDFERGDYLIQSLRLQVAKQLNNPPLGFLFAIKKQFSSDALDHGLKELQVNFMITYYIR